MDNGRLHVDATDCTNNEGKDKKHMKWTSRLDFVVTLIGYTIGYSDIWRVPYLTYRNGGAAFLIPYVTCLLVCGLPLYYMEIEMSQFSGKGIYSVWDFSPLFRGVTVTFFILGSFVVCVYPAMRAWSIEFLVNSFQSTLPWSSCDNAWNTDKCVTFKEPSHANNTNMSASGVINATMMTSFTLNGSDVRMMSAAEEFWQYHILNLSSGVDDVGPINWKYVLYIFIVHVIVYATLVKSVKSFGKVMYVTALLPMLLVVIIWIRALMLPGALKGMEFFIVPKDFSVLGKMSVWVEACFLAFFTLGPGWGGLATFGCHNQFRENILTDTVIVVAVTIAFGLVNGLAVFSVVGVMSQESGIPVPDIITSGGFSLGFVAYPQALTYLPYPQVWSVLFFLVLLMPGIDMETTILEPMLNFIEELFPKLRLRNRRLIVLAVLLTVVSVLELPFLTRAGAYFFQLVDWYGFTLTVVSVAALECFLYMWRYGGDRVSRDVTMMSDRPLPAFIRISSSYVTPFILLILLVISFATYRPPTYGTYIYPDYCNILGWMLVVLSLLPVFVTIAVKLCKANGTFIERLRQTTSPQKNWGPAESDFVEVYRESERTRVRTLAKVAWFNLTGRGGFDPDSVKLKCVADDEWTAMNIHTDC